MSDLNRQFFDQVHNAGQSDIKRIAAAGTYTIGEHERFIDVSMASLAGDVILNLPDASRVPGAIFSVFLTLFAGSNDLVVNGPGVGTDLASGDMDTTGEWIIVMSDGQRYLTLASNIA